MKTPKIKIWFNDVKLWGIVYDYMAGVLIVRLQKRNGFRDVRYVLPEEIVPHGNGLWRWIEK
jgi:hypothetical protein